MEKKVIILHFPFGDGANLESLFPFRDGANLSCLGTGQISEKISCFCPVPKHDNAQKGRISSLFAKAAVRRIFIFGSYLLRLSSEYSATPVIGVYALPLSIERAINTPITDAIMSPRRWSHAKREDDLPFCRSGCPPHIHALAVSFGAGRAFSACACHRNILQRQ